jgi:hypothetical protein
MGYNIDTKIMSEIATILQDNALQKVNLNFSGHETFPFRYTWLKKAVDAISKDSGAFDLDTALSDLGVGKNMVMAIEHWALVAGVIEKSKEGLQVSEFGRKLLSNNGWDPYLEDVASLWLLHWKLCTDIAGATSWYFVFNKLTQIEFTKEQLVHEIKQYAAVHNYKKSLNMIDRDVDCLIRTYVPSRAVQQNILEDSLECPLTELSLIQEMGQKGLYVFSRGYQRELPDEIFIYALLTFWDRFNKQRGSISFEDIAYSECSPGQVFKIDEDSLAHRLEGIEKLTHGILRYDETSRLRQVYRNKQENPDVYLSRYYK